MGTRTQNQVVIHHDAKLSTTPWTFVALDRPITVAVFHPSETMLASCHRCLGGRRRGYHAVRERRDDMLLTAEDVIRGSRTAWRSGASEEGLLRFEVIEN